MRWQLEVTFQEMRRHLGFETQTTVVGVSDPKNYTGPVGTVLVGDFVCASADEAGSGCLAASGGLVPQGSSDLRRCARFGTQGVVRPRADFLRGARRYRAGKSPTGIR